MECDWNQFCLAFFLQTNKENPINESHLMFFKSHFKSFSPFEASKERKNVAVCKKMRHHKIMLLYELI